MSGRGPDPAAQQPEPGIIVLLNGTSSSGKSSLVAALQDRFVEPALDAGLDKFIFMLAKSALDTHWGDILGNLTRSGRLGHQLVSAMHTSIAAIARSGLNVVADHVLVEQRWLLQCTDLFDGFRVYFVGVHCPPGVLDTREVDRKDRTLGQARAQYALVHRNCLYDIEVDTCTGSVADCAGRIEKYIAANPKPNGLLRTKRLLQSKKPYLKTANS